MSTTFYIELEGTTAEFLKQEGDPIDGYVLLEHDSIENAGATEDSKSRYNIDQRTGFKVLPHSLIKDHKSDALVRPESWDMRHPQRAVKATAERLRGAIRPEPANDVFVTTTEFLLQEDAGGARILQNGDRIII